MDLTIVDFLNISLIFFTIIIWTLSSIFLVLLSVILVKSIKILNTLNEIAWYYENVKQLIWIYSQIPSILKDYVKWLFSKKEDKN